MTPELKEIQISPIHGHGYIMELQVKFIMKYPQDWFRDLGKVRVRAHPMVSASETAQPSEGPRYRGDRDDLLDEEVVEAQLQLANSRRVHPTRALTCVARVRVLTGACSSAPPAN